MTTPAIGYPGPTSTYVPNTAASNSLVVGFSREASTFPVPRYVQHVMAQKEMGLYYVWASREGARIIQDDDAGSLWADGDAAPVGANNLEGMYVQSFVTKRRCYPFTMGGMAVDQADFPILAAESGVAAQRAMTARTMLVQSALSGATWGSNTATAGAILGDNALTWANGSVGYGGANGPNIKICIQYGQKVVHQRTLGTVQPRQLTLVINPTTAQRMAASTEIQDYIKQSPFALAQLRGDVPNQNGVWGLPTTLYGVDLIVEDTVRVTTKKVQPSGGTDTLTYVMPDGTAYLIAREGELQGIEGRRSYSTVQVFFYKDELTTQTKYDADNLRYLGRVISNYTPVVVSTDSGFKFTSIFG